VGMYPKGSMKKRPRVVVTEWAAVRVRVHGEPVDGEKKRTCPGPVGLCIAQSYQTVHENGEASTNSLSPTVGVRFSATPESL
jgi:hypothetical protein